MLITNLLLPELSVKSHGFLIFARPVLKMTIEKKLFYMFISHTGFTYFYKFKAQINSETNQVIGREICN